MDFLNQAKQYAPQAEKSLQSEQGQKLEDQFEKTTGIDIEKYVPGQQQQQSGGAPPASNVRPSSSSNDNQNADGNYQEYSHDSTSEGGYGGDPFSRANQMGGSNSGSGGQFGGRADNNSSASASAGDSNADDPTANGEGFRSSAGSEYGGSQPGASSGFEMRSSATTGAGHEGESNGRNPSFRGQSADNVGA